MNRLFSGGIEPILSLLGANSPRHRTVMGVTRHRYQNDQACHPCHAATQRSSLARWGRERTPPLPRPSSRVTRPTRGASRFALAGCNDSLTCIPYPGITRITILTRRGPGSPLGSLRSPARLDPGRSARQVAPPHLHHSLEYCCSFGSASLRRAAKARHGSPPTRPRGAPGRRASSARKVQPSLRRPPALSRQPALACAYERAG